MGYVADRWYKIVDGKRVPTERHGMGKRWQAVWRLDGGTGPERTKAFAIKAEAADYVSLMEAAIVRGEYVDPALGKRTLEEYAAQWLKTLGTGPTTRHAHALRLRVHILPALGHLGLGSITPSHVRGFLSERRRSGLAAGTVKVIRQTLRQVLAAAVEDGLIRTNPAASRTTWVAKDDRPTDITEGKIVPWTGAEVRRLHDALPDRYQVIVLLGAGLGLRMGEIAGLAVDDIDWMARKVHVRRQVRTHGGKHVYALPKHRRTRTVGLPADVAMLLSAYIKAFPPADVTLPWDEVDGEPVTARLLLTSRQVGRASRIVGPVNRTYLGHYVWKPALVEAGLLPPRPRGGQYVESRDKMFHALRHHYASVVLDQGGTLGHLAQALGHADPAFTARVYGHLQPAARVEPQAAIDRAGIWAPDVSQTEAQ